MVRREAGKLEKRGDSHEPLKVAMGEKSGGRKGICTLRNQPIVQG